MRLAAMILAATLALASSAGAASKSIWQRPFDIALRDTTGTAWTNIRQHAAGVAIGGDTDYEWAAPNLKIQNENTGAKCIAAALYWRKTGNDVFRTKVRDAVMAAKRSLDSEAEWDLRAGSGGYGAADTTIYSLGLARRLGAYLIAADLIDFEGSYPSDTSEFNSWLRSVPRTTMDGPGINPPNYALAQEAERAASGGSVGAATALLITRIYLGQADSVARSWKFFKAYSKRNQYPSDAFSRDPDGLNPGETTRYFVRTVEDGFGTQVTTGRPHKTWIANLDTANWVAISPAWTATQPAGTDSALRTQNKMPSTNHADSMWCQNFGGLTTVEHSVNIHGALILDLCRQCKSTCTGQPNEPICASEPLHANCECYPHDETGQFRWKPDSVGVMYAWGTVQELYMQMELFKRYAWNGLGAYGDSAFTYEWPTMKRVMEFMADQGDIDEGIGRIDYPYNASIPMWIHNNRYPSYLMTPPVSLKHPDDGIGFTDWTHRAATFDSAAFEVRTSHPNVYVRIAPPYDVLAYDVRVSLSPITDGNFHLAAASSNIPTPYTAGGAPDDYYCADTMDPDITYYYAMKYKNASGGWSNISRDTTRMPTSGGGGGCTDCEMDAAPPRDEAKPEIKQTKFTVAEARGRTDFYDVLGRKAKSIRPGVYVQHIMNNNGVVIEKRMVVVK